MSKIEKLYYLFRLFFIDEELLLRDECLFWVRLVAENL